MDAFIAIIFLVSGTCFFLTGTIHNLHNLAQHKQDQDS
jgi:hypothetical protein